MNAALGQTGVLLGLVAAIVGIAVIAVGLARGRDSTVRNGQIYAPVILLGAVVASLAMEHALLTHDFSLAYVADNNSRETPLLYTITGMWSALEGSILLWGLILGGYATAMVWRFRKRSTDRLVAWATLVVYVVAAFFFLLMAGPASPFRHVVGAIPKDGIGPNVLLQDNPLVAFHPPMLYLGFVGFTLPFAFAVASLITGRLDEGWQSETRRWTLFAWAFLSAGIVLGMWWSYKVLGWGGFWAWDPVENASFLPWLCGTAYLHSAMVQQRRGLLRIWNLSLIIATFSLTILGTFLTRSGVAQSVHAFSDSTIGPLLIGFFALVVVVGVGLIAWRGDQLRSEGGIDAPLSREGAFLGNNLLFVAFAFVVLLGTVFPFLYEALRGGQVTVRSPYFNTLTVPIGLALLFLMGVAPALPWRKATATVMRGRLAVPAALAVITVVACVLGGIRGIEPLLAFGLGAFAGGSAGRSLALSVRGAWRGARVRGASPGRAVLAGWRGFAGRANGGMVVHIGIVIIAVGLAAATAFGHRGEVHLAPGQSASFGGHTVEYLGFRTVKTPASTAQQAVLRIDGGGPYYPALTQFGAGTTAVGTPAVDSSFTDDVYLTINGIPDTGNVITFGVVVQPLVAWLWGGAVLLLVGSALAAAPGRRRRLPTDPVSAPLPGLDDVPGSGDGPEPSGAAQPGTHHDAQGDGNEGDGHGAKTGTEREPAPVPAGEPAREPEQVPVGSGERS